MVRFKTFLLVGLLALVASLAGTTGAAAQGMSRPAPAGPAPGTTYTVQRGDSLSSIAFWAYGNAGAWSCIWYANNWIANPHYIQAGWRIVIPASGSCGGGGALPSTARYHTVTRGETLSGIACVYYLDCNYWRIYNANRDKLWNINYVAAGTVLRIP